MWGPECRSSFTQQFRTVMTSLHLDKALGPRRQMAQNELPEVSLEPFWCPCCRPTSHRLPDASLSHFGPPVHQMVQSGPQENFRKERNTTEAPQYDSFLVLCVEMCLDGWPKSLELRVRAAPQHRNWFDFVYRKKTPYLSERCLHPGRGLWSCMARPTHSSTLFLAPFF